MKILLVCSFLFLCLQKLDAQVPDTRPPVIWREILPGYEEIIKKQEIPDDLRKPEEKEKNTTQETQKKNEEDTEEQKKRFSLTEFLQDRNTVNIILLIIIVIAFVFFRLGKK